MKIYIDDNMIFLNGEDGYTNVYTPYSHNTLKISDSVEKILRKFISIGSGVDFEPKELLDIFEEECSIEDLSPVLEDLKEMRFIFDSKEDFDNGSFHKFIRNSKKVKLCIAYLHVTQRCNLNCSYCYNKINLNNQKRELTFEEWIDSINKLHSEGVNRFVITGGEPLLRKDLIEILKHLRSLQCEISLLTNGTLLNKNYNLLEYVDTVTISLDSIDTDINNKNRENSHSYNMINNLESIPQEYKDKFIVRSVITNNNINNINEIKSYVENKLGMRHKAALFSPNSMEEVELIPDYSEYLSSLKGKEFIEFNEGIINCGGCYSEIAVDSNGALYPCQALIKEDLKISNILSDNWINELKESDITCSFMKRDVNNLGDCKECNYKYICGGGCRAIAYNVYGDLNAKLDCYCDHMKKSSNMILLNTMFEMN